MHVRLLRVFSNRASARRSVGVMISTGTNTEQNWAWQFIVMMFG